MPDKLYSFDEIRQAGDCLRFVIEVLGLPVKDGRCAAVWRGGDNPQSVSLERDKYYDHGIKDGGGIIKLCMVSKFPNDLFSAASCLGEWLKLEPKDTFHEHLKLIATHQYKDPATGAVVHEALRFKREDGSKTMRQRRPDPANPGKYIYNLDGITPILYRMSDWINAKNVLIAEGEAKTDAVNDLGLPCTTMAMGAGKWLDHYNQHFAGKGVVILPDNDDPGILHAQHVANSLYGIARAVKIVYLPDLEASEDVYEYIHKYKHTKADLVALINATPAYKPENLQTPEQTELAEASEANERPFANYRMKKIANAEGKDETKPEPIPMNQLVADIHKRFFGFPHRIGEVLFDHDRKTNRITAIRDTSSLFAWISQKSGNNYKWKNMDGAIMREELFQSLHNSARQFQMISGVPHWPLREDVYYTYGTFPKATGGKLDGFINLFSFATPEDKQLYKVFLATLIYYRPKIDKPIWIFDSDEGQGVGKTKAAEYAALLVGGDDPECGEPLWIDWMELNNDQAIGNVGKRLLSASGRKKRMVLIDNVDGYFRSTKLATFVTQGSISGMAPYGHGEETRTNDLVFVITCNSATLARDLVSRSMMIKMKKAESNNHRWNDEVERYIKTYRMDIVAEIVETLQKGIDYQLTPATRFKIWETDVMAPILGDSISLEDAWKQSEQSKQDADSDSEEADIINDTIEHKVGDYVQDQDHKNVWIQSKLLSDWCVEAIPGFGGRDGRNVKTKLRNLVKVGLLPRLSFGMGDKARYKMVRGALWSGHDVSENSYCVILKLLPNGSVEQSF